MGGDGQRGCCAQQPAAGRCAAPEVGWVAAGGCRPYLSRQGWEAGSSGRAEQRAGERKLKICPAWARVERRRPEDENRFKFFVWNFIFSTLIGQQLLSRGMRLNFAGPALFAGAASLPRISARGPASLTDAKIGCLRGSRGILAAPHNAGKLRIPSVFSHTPLNHTSCWHVCWETVAVALGGIGGVGE